MKCPLLSLKRIFHLAKRENLLYTDFSGFIISAAEKVFILWDFQWVLSTILIPIVPGSSIGIYGLKILRGLNFVPVRFRSAVFILFKVRE